ncbi:protein of unknown function [Hyphomicrobium sp. 1Nfss2.1]
MRALVKPIGHHNIASSSKRTPQSARASLFHDKQAPAGVYLLNLGFFEFDVLPGDRVVLLEYELLGACARVLLRHVKEPRACGRKQLDLLRYGLGHVRGNLRGT